MNNINQLERNFKRIMDNLINDLRIFVSNFILSLCDNKIMIDLRSKNNITKVIDTSSHNCSAVVYDIYYHLLLLQKESELQSFTINDFIYPNFFTIKISQSDYDLNIMGINDEVCTYITLNGKTVIITELGYNNQYKRHTTYDSIINELYALKLWI